MHENDIELSTRLLNGSSSSEDNMDDKKDDQDTTVARSSSWINEGASTLVVKGIDPVYEAKAQVLNDAVGGPLQTKDRYICVAELTGLVDPRNRHGLVSVATLCRRWIWLGER